MDRHGIVTPAGLMPPNDYLAGCALYLGESRPEFKGRKVGETTVGSSMIERRRVSWTVVRSRCVYFCGEESAGSSFLRQDGAVWTTDKDGLIAGLLAAEMTAVTANTTRPQAGRTYYARIDSPSQAEIRTRLSKIDPKDVQGTVGGDDIITKLTRAPGNNAPISGIKLVTANGWIAARPSGTENIIKIYGEIFVSKERLAALQTDAIELLVL